VATVENMYKVPNLIAVTKGLNLTFMGQCILIIF